MSILHAVLLEGKPRMAYKTLDLAQMGAIRTGSAWDGWKLDDIYDWLVRRGDSHASAADLVDSILTNRIAAIRKLRGGQVPEDGDALALVDRPVSRLAFKGTDAEKQKRRANDGPGGNGHEVAIYEEET